MKEIQVELHGEVSGDRKWNCVERKVAEQECLLLRIGNSRLKME